MKKRLPANECYWESYRLGLYWLTRKEWESEQWLGNKHVTERYGRCSQRVSLFSVSAVSAVNIGAGFTSRLLHSVVIMKVNILNCTVCYVMLQRNDVRRLYRYFILAPASCGARFPNCFLPRALTSAHYPSNFVFGALTFFPHLTLYLFPSHPETWRAPRFLSKRSRFWISSRVIPFSCTSISNYGFLLPFLLLFGSGLVPALTEFNVKSVEDISEKIC